MVLSDKSFSKICEFSYKVENKKIVNGNTVDVNGKDYQVIDTEDNQNTGFQAMAVAPIVDGKPDYNHVTVAYAGTNFGDAHDADTDYVDIADNITSLASGGGGFGNNHGGKALSANQRVRERDAKYGNVFDDNATGFYERVDKQVKAHGGIGVHDVTGHSLGGAEALFIAAKYHVPATTFSAANPSRHLTKEQEQWLKDHDYDVTNYYRPELVARWQRSKVLGRSIELAPPNLENWEIPFYLLTRYTGGGHRQSTYEFLPDGSAVTMAQSDNAIQQRLYDGDRQAIGQMRRYLEHDGHQLTHSEQVLLDDLEAQAILRRLKRMTDDTLLTIGIAYKEFYTEQEKVWPEAVDYNQRHNDRLSRDEVVDAIHDGNCYYQTNIAGVTDDMKEKVQKAARLSEEYDNLLTKINSDINTQVKQDADLANKISQFNKIK